MTKFLVLKLQIWDSFEADPDGPKLPIKVSIAPGPGCVGFLSVYDSREAAESAHPGAQIVEIEEVNQ